MGSPSISQPLIYVYDGPGVGKMSLGEILLTLKDSLGSDYDVRTLGSAEIIEGQWVDDAALLVMPGGADIPYMRYLSGQGNSNIKRYVAQGGKYLGICAGAYYGSGYVEFDRNGPLEVLGKRELAFFPGKAVGPILAKYQYKDLSGVRAAHLTWHDHSISSDDLFVYFNGGPYFPHADEFEDVAVLAYYQLDKPQQEKAPAIIQISYGSGTVILSGVHFEYDPMRLNKQDPYLQPILPQLQQGNMARKQLIDALLSALSLNKNESNVQALT
ncbi:MAG: BPL-N domain-containing protein [Pseudomonadota bacterium]